MAQGVGVNGVTDRVNSQIPNVTLVPFKVTFGATGAPTKNLGAFTIARTAAGRYTVTFLDKYYDCAGLAQLTDYQGTATGGTWETFTEYVASTGVLVLSHTVADSEADPSSGDIISGTFIMLATDY